MGFGGKRCDPVGREQLIHPLRVPPTYSFWRFRLKMGTWCGLGAPWQLVK